MMLFYCIGKIRDFTDTTKTHPTENYVAILVNEQLNVG